MLQFRMGVIDRVAEISAETFKEEYLDANRPVILESVMRNWNAMRSWSLDHFREMAPHAKAHIEKGNIFQGETDFEDRRFEEFADDLEEGLERDDQGKIPYFAYFNIFDLFPDTKNDVDFSLLTQFTIKNYPAGWIGPAGTLTGYHFDWPDNLLAQVVGSKEIRLVSPDQSDRMYPNRKFDYLSRQSSVDVEDLDEEKFPLFSEVDEQRVVLQSGEMIFIPRHWWHCIRSLDFSISVNNFGYTLSRSILDGLPEFGRLILHRLGLYQRRNCCCHMPDQNGSPIAQTVN